MYNDYEIKQFEKAIIQYTKMLEEEKNIEKNY